jgi:hypothetical protein
MVAAATAERGPRGGRGVARVPASRLVALPGEKLSRAQMADGAESQSVEAPAEDIEVLDESQVAEGGEDVQTSEGGRRRRRRGGRGRGHGGRSQEGLAPGEEAAEPLEAGEPESPAVAPATRPNQFGSFWDSQIGMVGRPERLTPMTPADEDDFAEPEIPEYLLAERRRGGRGQGQGQSQGRGGGGGGRGVRSAYASAVDRERYGRSAAPRFTEPVRQAQPPRRRDERPQRAPQPQQHRGGAGAPRSTGRDSAEPWSEVPPELEEILRAQLSTKLSRQNEAPSAPTPEVSVAAAGASESGETPKAGARRGGRRKVEAAPVQAAEAMPAIAEAHVEAAEALAKPAARSRRKPAAAEVAAPAVEIGEAPAAAAPKRRAPARKKPVATEGEVPPEAAGE